MLYAARRETLTRTHDITEPVCFVYSHGARGAEKGASADCPGKFGIVYAPNRTWACSTYRCRFTALNLAFQVGL